MENNQLKNWINHHKKELIIIATLTGGGTLCYLAHKYHLQLPKIKVDTQKVIVKTKQVIEESVKVIPDEILFNLTGNMKTARELGNIVLCTAQDVNKRLVAAGLCIKMPNVEYRLTKEGMKLAQLTSKTTFYGHDFTNIEWDEKVIDYIFSPEELNRVNKLKETYANLNNIN